MSPRAFIKARKKASPEDRYHHTTVEERPYFPFLAADPSNLDTIKDVTAHILGLSKNCSHNLVVSVVNGGNTNQLYCVSSIQASNGNPVLPESVLVRIFGAQGLIDRDVETSTYAALSKQGLALAYFGRFANGRIEEWSDWKPLTENDMAKPDISSYIAMQLCRLHCQFIIPKHLLEYHNPQGTPTMWTQLNDWLMSARTATFRNDKDAKQAKALQLDNLVYELEWLRQDIISPTAKVGFCHNDLLASNILSSVPLQLIDFEYGGINYLSYDIANHFNEFAGGTAPEDNSTPDYNKFPDNAFQRNFCRAYLEECSTCSKQLATDKELEQQTDILMEEVQGFILANHLVWGLWGVVQSLIATDENGFDYMHYGSCRINRYFELKQEILMN
jgi:ethanolamine kinase